MSRADASRCHGVDFLQFRGTGNPFGSNSLRGTTSPAKAFGTFARRAKKSDVSGTSVGDAFTDAETGLQHSVWNQSPRSEVKNSHSVRSGRSIHNEELELIQRKSEAILSPLSEAILDKYE